jgi:hypothetical protein
MFSNGLGEFLEAFCHDGAVEGFFVDFTPVDVSEETGERWLGLEAPGAWRQERSSGAVAAGIDGVEVGTRGIAKEANCAAAEHGWQFAQCLIADTQFTEKCDHWTVSCELSQSMESGLLSCREGHVLVGFHKLNGAPQSRRSVKKSDVGLPSEAGNAITKLRVGEELCRGDTPGEEIVEQRSVAAVGDG